MKKRLARPATTMASTANRALFGPLGSAMFSEVAWTEIAARLRLSRRELQIVRAMFDDRTESAIATDLGVAKRTVHTHFERLHRKLAVADRLQLVLRIMEEFLVLMVTPHNHMPITGVELSTGRCPLRA